MTASVRSCFKQKKNYLIVKDKDLYTRFDEVKKSSNDKKNYRCLTLKNQMKVVLVSDPNTKKSAACLSLNVGYFSDPDDLPGLAGLCAGTLLSGCRRCSNFKNFVQSHSGRSKFSVLSDHTNFYFDVDTTFFKKALEKFLRIFSSPAFGSSTIRAQLNNINKEYKVKLNDDSWRIRQLDKSFANPEHPYSKFEYCSKSVYEKYYKSKNVNVGQQLRMFHDNWYSGNLMSLCVLGSESLDELESLVTNTFHKIRNNDVNLPSWNNQPFRDENLRTKFYILPKNKNIRQLRVIFPVPDLREHYRVMPLSYWINFLNREFEGSLHTVLKKRGLICYLFAVNERPARGFDFLSINVEMTVDGLYQIDEIMSLIFQYIERFRETGPVESIFNEQKDIASTNFLFPDYTFLDEIVISMAENLHIYPMEDILIGPNLPTDWKPDLIRSVLRHLIPEKVRLQIIASEFEAVVNNYESYSKIRFKKTHIQVEILKQWENAESSAIFRSPEMNTFIPTKFDIKPCANANRNPAIIRDSDYVRFWFKQDNTFLHPEATLTLSFIIVKSNEDPLSHTLTNIYAELVSDAIYEVQTNAILGGLRLNFGRTKHGLTLCFAGFNHKMPILLMEILDRMYHLRIADERFQELKDEFAKDLDEYESDNPFEFARQHIALLLTEYIWTPQDLRKSLDMITIEKFKEFVPEMLRKVFVECLLHGNFTRTEGLEMARILESNIKSVKHVRPVLEDENLVFKQLRLPQGSHYLYEVNVDYSNKSSCACVYFQLGAYSVELNVLLQIVCQIMYHRCYQMAKRETKTGYCLHYCHVNEDSTLGLAIMAKGVKNPNNLEHEVEKFLNSIENTVSKLNKKRLRKFIKPLIIEKQRKPELLIDLSVELVEEITTRRYSFDRKNLELKFLESVTKRQVFEFFKIFLSEKSIFKRKLSIHLRPTLKPPEWNKGKIINIRATKIRDVVAFKNSLQLLPIL